MADDKKAERDARLEKALDLLAKVTREARAGARRGDWSLVRWKMEVAQASASRIRALASEQKSDKHGR